MSAEERYKRAELAQVMLNYYWSMKMLLLQWHRSNIGGPKAKRGFAKTIGDAEAAALLVEEGLLSEVNKGSPTLYSADFDTLEVFKGKIEEIVGALIGKEYQIGDDYDPGVSLRALVDPGPAERGQRTN